jgi:hypothetical protein
MRHTDEAVKSSRLYELSASLTSVSSSLFVLLRELIYGLGCFFRIVL